KTDLLSISGLKNIRRKMGFFDQVLSHHKLPTCWHMKCHWLPKRKKLLDGMQMNLSVCLDVSAFRWLKTFRVYNMTCKPTFHSNQRFRSVMAYQPSFTFSAFLSPAVDSY